MQNPEKEPELLCSTIPNRCSSNHEYECSSCSLSTHCVTSLSWAGGLWPVTNYSQMPLASRQVRIDTSSSPPVLLLSLQKAHGRGSGQGQGRGGALGEGFPGRTSPWGESQKTGVMWDLAWLVGGPLPRRNVWVPHSCCLLTSWAILGLWEPEGPLWA